MQLHLASMHSSNLTANLADEEYETHVHLLCTFKARHDQIAELMQKQALPMNDRHDILEAHQMKTNLQSNRHFVITACYTQCNCVYIQSFILALVIARLKIISTRSLPGCKSYVFIG